MLLTNTSDAVFSFYKPLDNMHRIVGYHRQQKMDICYLHLSRCGCYANIGFRGALMPSYLHVRLEMHFRTQPMSMLRCTQLTLIFLPASRSFSLTRFLCLPACPSWIIDILQTSMASGNLPSLMCTRHWLVLPLSFYSTSFIIPPPLVSPFITNYSLSITVKSVQDTSIMSYSMIPVK